MKVIQTEDKKQIVAKSNIMVQKSRINLTTVENRIINYMISKIKATDKNLDYITFDYYEFCEIAGFKKTNNFYYVKQSIHELYNKSWQVFDGKAFVPIKWLDDYKITDNIVQLKFHFRMADFLINLISQGNYTTYELETYFRFKCKYSFILYDYFKSFVFRNYGKFGSLQQSISIDELKEKLGIDNEYKEFRDFHKYVLKKSIDDINRNSDLIIDYQTLSKNRKTTGILFTFKENKTAEELLSEIHNKANKPKGKQNK